MSGGAAARYAAAMDDGQKAWLTTKEAASYLSITPRTLYRLIDVGEVPAYKFGRVIRLRRAEVDEFIERSRIEPGTLAHLYPESTSRAAEEDDDGEDEVAE